MLFRIIHNDFDAYLLSKFDRFYGNFNYLIDNIIFSLLLNYSEILKIFILYRDVDMNLTSTELDTIWGYAFFQFKIIQVIYMLLFISRYFTLTTSPFSRKLCLFSSSLSPAFHLDKLLWVSFISFHFVGVGKFLSVGVLMCEMLIFVLLSEFLRSKLKKFFSGVWMCVFVLLWSWFVLFASLVVGTVNSIRKNQAKSVMKCCFRFSFVRSCFCTNWKRCAHGSGKWENILCECIKMKVFSEHI